MYLLLFNCFYSLTSYPPYNNQTTMEQNHPRLLTVTIKLNKQFFAMVFFISSFLLASYYHHARKITRAFLLPMYSTSHRTHKPPHAADGAQLQKNFFIFYLPRNLLINQQIILTFLSFYAYR